MVLVTTKIVFYVQTSINFLPLPPGIQAGQSSALFLTGHICNVLRGQWPRHRRYKCSTNFLFGIFTTRFILCLTVGVYYYVKGTPTTQGPPSAIETLLIIHQTKRYFDPHSHPNSFQGPTRSRHQGTRPSVSVSPLVSPHKRCFPDFHFPCLHVSQFVV